SGAVFVVVILALVPLAPMPPGADASPAQISDWYQSHRSAVLLQASLRGLAGLLQLIFMAGIASVVARTQGRTGVLTQLACGGALAHSRRHGPKRGCFQPSPIDGRHSRIRALPRVALGDKRRIHVAFSSAAAKFTWQSARCLLNAVFQGRLMPTAALRWTRSLWDAEAVAGPARLTWLLAVGPALFALLALMLGFARGLGLEGAFAEFLVSTVVAAVATGAVGAVILSRQPMNRAGWLFCVFGMGAGLTAAAGQYARYAL